jgi:hypothetical protein
MCDFSKRAEGLTEIDTITTDPKKKEVTISPPTDYTERFSYKKEIKYEVAI